MNLLLYLESKAALAQLVDGEIQANDPFSPFGELVPVLPDALFEELGYFGALDDYAGEEPIAEDNYDGFLNWLEQAVPV